jgi:hypothetical protein
MNRSIFVVCVIGFGAYHVCAEFTGKTTITPTGMTIRETVTAVNPVEAVNRVLANHPHAIPVSCHRVHR